MKKIMPFVKWAGGKGQLKKDIEKHIPTKYGTYHEPFVGGGALLFYLQPKRAIISDINSELIIAYNTIKSSYKKLREYLLLMEYGHSEEFFYKIRGIDQNELNNYEKLSFSDSNLLKTARFIYLNKAGFNGLYRVNKSGYFNVPCGKKDEVKTHEYPNLRDVSEYLKNNNITIKKRSFTNIIKYVKKGDFVYFDPPYDYDNKGFDAYQKNSFGKTGQRKLANICKKLDDMNVMFMVSNHNTELIRELYKDFKIKIFMAQRNIGGKGASREKVEEVLITNYD